MYLAFQGMDISSRGRLVDRHVFGGKCIGEKGDGTVEVKHP